MDSAAFDFPTTVSRGTDMSASVAESRTGHHVYAPLPLGQVERGRQTFVAQWHATVAGQMAVGAEGSFDAMQVLRSPVARATCAAVLEGVDVAVREQVADEVLAWIDALGPVISPRRSPGRWSRARRHERRTRLDLETTLAAALPRCGISDSPQVVATLLAAGVQVPIAAGAWLLVFLAAHPEGEFDPDHVVWETLRIAPPTWITARVTTGPVHVRGQQVGAGELVLVSPLLLGRLSDLAPDGRADLATFCPERWRGEEDRPGAWLPFGAGAHSCPGRALGLQLLRELSSWATAHRLRLIDPVTIDQSRGIFPSPARLAFSARATVDP